ncbi:MAG: hypothetical protein SFV24_23275, partial [Gemmatimonadales bacterium]|nr:hypothetical protein [Gemmatimonadales bacterium]
GDKASVILDADGSLTGTAGQFVAANNPLLVTGACQLRSTWNAYVCANRFVNLQVRGAQSQTVAPLDLTRDDAAVGSFVGVPGNLHVVSASVVPNRKYTVTFKAGVPTMPQVYANQLAAGEWVRVTLPYPSATFKVYRDYNTSTAIPAAATLADLEAGSGDKYFYDAAAGRLHLKAQAKTGRDWATLFVVP